MAEGAFWSNQERAQSVVQQTKSLRAWTEPWDKLWARVQGAIEMDVLLASDPDPGMTAEVDRETSAIREEVDAFKLRTSKWSR